jgi:AAA+ ATPase superfamily predicted ATPase
MFYFRKDELERLKKVYRSPEGGAVALYGRRRTGKSALILESFKETPEIPSLYFLCASSTYQGVLDQFRSEFAEFLKISLDQVPFFQSFRQLFSYFVPHLSGKKILLAIDEFPYLSRKKEGQEVASEFNEIIEKGLAGSPLVLILCGSNVRFMNDVVNDATSPLHGRFKETLLLLPFSYEETAAILSSFSPFDQLAAYGASGGVAEYVFHFAEYPQFASAVEALYLRVGGRLYNEAEQLLNFEFEDASTYQAILTSIGSSRKRPSEIAKAIGIAPNAFYYFANLLVAVGILGEYKTAFSKKKRDASYFIKDPFFRFYYGFIAPLRSKIAYLTPSEVYDLAFQEEALHTYLGPIYEEAVVKGALYRLALAKKIPFVPEEILPWVGLVPNRKGEWGETEIDLCGYSATQVILGECKAKNKKMGLSVYQSLLLKAGYVPTGSRQKYYLLASFSGFEDSVLALKKDGVFLLAGSTLL